MLCELLPVGKYHFAIIDSDSADSLRKFFWVTRKFRRCVYAVTYIGGGDWRRRINMHRLIARTPFGMVCHHKNGNTLDNRRSNLENMSKQAHKKLHANQKLLVKFEQLTTEPTQ